LELEHHLFFDSEDKQKYRVMEDRQKARNIFGEKVHRRCAHWQNERTFSAETVGPDGAIGEIANQSCKNTSYLINGRVHFASAAIIHDENIIIMFLLLVQSNKEAGGHQSWISFHARAQIDLRKIRKNLFDVRMIVNIIFLGGPQKKTIGALFFPGAYNKLISNVKSYLPCALLQIRSCRHGFDTIFQFHSFLLSNLQIKNT